jgi:hypothetical protein
VQAVEFAKLCFYCGYQKGNTSLKMTFLWFILLNDINLEFGCGRGVIDLLAPNLPEGTE